MVGIMLKFTWHGFGVRDLESNLDLEGRFRLSLVSFGDWALFRGAGRPGLA